MSGLSGRLFDRQQDGFDPHQALRHGACLQPGYHPAGRGKTEFDALSDRAEVTQLLNAGCVHMRKAFDIEDINLDDLIATAADDKEALATRSRR